MIKFYQSVDCDGTPQWVFEHNDMEISSPFLSECLRFTVEPSYYGLTIDQANTLINLNAK